MFIGITFVQLRYICCTRRRRIQEDKNGHTKNKLCENFVIVLKLWCILSLFGLTWLFGAFTVTQSALYVFSTLFVVFSSLQGFFIFVFLCILSKDTLKCYRSIFCRWNKSFESPESPSLATKSTSLATKDGDHIYKPIYDDATKYALAQELSTKVKLYEPEPDVIETSTFKPV